MLVPTLRQNPGRGLKHHPQPLLAVMEQWNRRRALVEERVKGSQRDWMEISKGQPLELRKTPKVASRPEIP